MDSDMDHLIEKQKKLEEDIEDIARVLELLDDTPENTSLLRNFFSQREAKEGSAGEPSDSESTPDQSAPLPAASWPGITDASRQAVLSMKGATFTISEIKDQLQHSYPDAEIKDNGLHGMIQKMKRANQIKVAIPKRGRRPAKYTQGSAPFPNAPEN